MEAIYFPLGKTRPTRSKVQRIWMKLYNLPIIPFKAFVRKKLKQSLGLPSSTSIGEGFFCSSGNLSVGESTGLGKNLQIIAYAPVKIGHHCSFSFDNKIITSTHDFKEFSTVIAKPIEIGDNVWITSNVTILPGVKIGSNTVIGAGSVVTHDIPSGVLAAGNPCKVIKTIKFSIE